MLDMVYYIESRENMYSFLNDYSEGAHPLVLDALIHTNKLLVMDVMFIVKKQKK